MVSKHACDWPIAAFAQSFTAAAADYPFAVYLAHASNASVSDHDLCYIARKTEKTKW